MSKKHAACLQASLLRDCGEDVQGAGPEAGPGCSEHPKEHRQFSWSLSLLRLNPDFLVFAARNKGSDSEVLTHY